MRLLKSHPILRLANSYLVDSPQPINLSYSWNFGSLLGFCLIIQIVTGVTLAMHYNPSVVEAFNSVEHIMRDVNNGWLIRYLHSNTASAFFFLVYLHIGRGMYYGSYRAPRTLVWTIGTVIFILMMATAFLGYVLPYGQMSLWGATVITNLMSAIPWVGQDIVEFIWGGFSVNNATLNRFFSLHFVLPFVLAALVLMHLIVLHDTAGSGNPLGVSGNYDRIPFAPYYIFKDLITIFLFIFVLSLFVFFMPNVLGDSENYVMANPMQTPAAIVPEWYLLPFYAILRSIPNKLLGVIAMFSAILILLLLPITDVSRSRGMQFRPLSKLAFYVFVSNFLILMKLGAKHVESPFIELGQLSTVFYFLYFSVIMYSITLIENTLVDISLVYRYTTSYDTTNNDTAMPYIFTNMPLHSNMGIVVLVTPLNMSSFLDAMSLFSDTMSSYLNVKYLADCHWLFSDAISSYLNVKYLTDCDLWYLVCTSLVAFAAIGILATDGTDTKPAGEVGDKSDGKKDGDKKGKGNCPRGICPCEHNIKDVTRLQDKDRLVFWWRCLGGFSGYDFNGARGHICLACGKVWCPNPGCACKGGNLGNGPSNTPGNPNNTPGNPGNTPGNPSNNRQ